MRETGLILIILLFFSLGCVESQGGTTISGGDEQSESINYEAIKLDAIDDPTIITT